MFLFSGCRVEGCDWGREWGKVRSLWSSLFEKYVCIERGNEGWLVFFVRGCFKGFYFIVFFLFVEVVFVLRIWFYFVLSGFLKYIGVLRVGLYFFFLK